MQRSSYCLHLPCYLLLRSITTFRGPSSSVVRHICDARVCSNRTATWSNPNGIRTRVNQAQMDSDFSSWRNDLKQGVEIRQIKLDQLELNRPPPQPAINTHLPTALNQEL